MDFLPCKSMTAACDSICCLGTDPRESHDLILVCQIFMDSDHVSIQHQFFKYHQGFSGASRSIKVTYYCCLSVCLLRLKGSRCRDRFAISAKESLAACCVHQGADKGVSLPRCQSPVADCIFQRRFLRRLQLMLAAACINCHGGENIVLVCDIYRSRRPGLNLKSPRRKGLAEIRL